LTLARRLFPEFFAGKAEAAAGSRERKIRTKYGLPRTKCVRLCDLTATAAYFLVMAGTSPSMTTFDDLSQ
jgi:hypothetical protein